MEWKNELIGCVRRRRALSPLAMGDDGSGPHQITSYERDELSEAPDEPPIVARMVVEIRSDGLRTIARGAMEDIHTGQKVAVVAKGTTPIALAASLAKSMFSAPMLAGNAVKALLRARLGRTRD